MRAYASILLVLFLVSTTFAQNRKDKLNKYMQLLNKNDKAMLSVTILEDGKLYYKNATGFASVNDGIKNSTETKFRIGSITKMFTSILIFQLIEEGKLSLDTKLSEFYPMVPNAGKITIDQLLRHRSGIYNFTDDNKYYQYYTSAKTHAQMIDIISTNDPIFEPGEKYSYSNSNYILLGYIVEKITKMKYEKAVEKRILKPLSLDNTYYGNEIDPKENEAYSYKFIDNVWQLEPQTDMTIPHGAGAMVSSAIDLSLFIDALFNNKIIAKKALQQMMDIEDGYGRGMMQFPFYDRQAFGHEGGIDGFVSIVAYFPKDKITFCAMTNAVNYNFNDILIGLLSIYFDRPYDLPDLSARAVTITAEELANYAGIYSSEALPLKITIMLKGDQLFAQATGQNEFPLTPFGLSEFRFDPAGIIINFTKDKDGNVQYSSFILNKGGGKFPYTKEADNN